MKIDLTKQSEIYLVHKLANGLEKHTKLNAFFGHHWRNSSTYTPQYDLILFDDKEEIKVVIKINIERKSPIRMFKFTKKSFILPFEDFYKCCLNENIPVFWVYLNEKNEIKVLNNILGHLDEKL